MTILPMAVCRSLLSFVDLSFVEFVAQLVNKFNSIMPAVGNSRLPVGDKQREKLSAFAVREFKLVMVALEKGATNVRVGSTIFGARNYANKS